ncbi:MAG: nucleoside transporter C-terminal domain-containing protein [Verrucomicrobiota bacterium]
MDFLMTLGRAAFGMAVFIGIAYLLSEKRGKVRWSFIGIGLSLQFVMAVLILKVPFFYEAMRGVSGFFYAVVSFSNGAAEQLFGMAATDPKFGFAFSIIPTIIFFSALSAVLYHLKVLQCVVFVFAWVLSKTLRLSGAECLAASANVFIGQTEAPLVVKPYLKGMNGSEILALMTGGMATIAGGVLAVYMSVLGGEDPEQVITFGQHLLTASFLNAPAALVMAKIVSPQTEKVDEHVAFPKEKQSESLLDAATKGTTDGIALALNVGGMLIAFIALIALANWIVSQGIGNWTGLNGWVASVTGGRFTEFNVSFLVGVVSVPFAFLLGVPNEDLLIVGQLLGERLVVNEFIAYLNLGEFKNSGVLEDPKSILITTYALCGFANISSLGIQVGGISVLEKSQRRNLLKYGPRALLAGMLACYMTAVIASTVSSF